MTGDELTDRAHPLGFGTGHVERARERAVHHVDGTELGCRVGPLRGPVTHGLHHAREPVHRAVFGRGTRVGAEHAGRLGNRRQQLLALRAADGGGVDDLPELDIGDSHAFAPERRIVELSHREQELAHPGEAHVEVDRCGRLRRRCRRSDRRGRCPGADPARLALLDLVQQAPGLGLVLAAPLGLGDRVADRPLRSAREHAELALVAHEVHELAHALVEQAEVALRDRLGIGGQARDPALDLVGRQGDELGVEAVVLGVDVVGADLGYGLARREAAYDAERLAQTTDLLGQDRALLVAQQVDVAPHPVGECGCAPRNTSASASAPRSMPTTASSLSSAASGVASESRLRVTMPSATARSVAGIAAPPRACSDAATPARPSATVPRARARSSRALVRVDTLPDPPMTASAFPARPRPSAPRSCSRSSAVVSTSVATSTTASSPASSASSTRAATAQASATFSSGAVRLATRDSVARTWLELAVWSAKPCASCMRVSPPVSSAASRRRSGLPLSRAPPIDSIAAYTLPPSRWRTARVASRVLEQVAAKCHHRAVEVDADAEPGCGQHADVVELVEDVGPHRRDRLDDGRHHLHRCLHPSHDIALDREVAPAGDRDARGADRRAGVREAGRQGAGADVDDAVPPHLRLLDQAERDPAPQRRVLEEAQGGIERRRDVGGDAEHGVEHVARGRLRRDRDVAGEVAQRRDRGLAPSHVLAGNALDRVLLDAEPADRPGVRPGADAGVAEVADGVADDAHVEDGLRAADEHAGDHGAAALDAVAGDLDVGDRAGRRAPAPTTP